MKAGKLILILAAVVTLSVVTTSALYALGISSVKEIRKIPMDIEVGDSAGFTLDSDSLHFGRTVPGGAVSRTMNIFHEYGYPLLVEIEAGGQLSDWLKVSDNNFILESGEKKKLEFAINIPRDAEFGAYTGSVSIILKVPNNIN